MMNKINRESILKKLTDYSDIDLNNIKPEDVNDIDEIKISRRKSSEERIVEFLSNVKNPYVFKIKGKLVQIAFSDSNRTAEDCLTNVLKKVYR